MCLSFLLPWLPYAVLTVVLLIKGEASDVAYIICIITAQMSMDSNSIVYSLVYRTFKSAFKLNSKPSNYIKPKISTKESQITDI